MESCVIDDDEEYNRKSHETRKEGCMAVVSEDKQEMEARDDGELEADTLKQNLEGIIERNGVGVDKLMMPLRIAVTGQGFGADLFISMEMLGKETVMRQIDRALSSLAQE